MSRALRLLVFASLVLMGALSASLFTALKTRPHPTLRQVRAVLFDNWGLYGVFQLNVGLLLAAVWILCVHRNKLVALLWIFAMAFVGHIATIAYVVYRAFGARTMADIFAMQPGPAKAEVSGPAIHSCDAKFNVDLPEPAAPDTESPAPASADESTHVSA